jgi:peptidyl-prolyl cis-trans isomerase B (cyclophilin B)
MSIYRHATDHLVAPRVVHKMQFRSCRKEARATCWLSMSKATPSNEVAVLKTSYGEMTLAFWPDVAPETVANFKKLARAGFYDGTAFHRIMKGFMVQGGCPNTKEGENGMPGTGGPGYKIKAEFNPKSHVRGVISMARSSHPDSAGSQFFLCHGDAKFLDRQYTAFGELIAGDDVLERIANVPTKSSGGGEKSTPIERVALESIKIVTQE